MTAETFWYSDPNVLFTKDTWYKFVPTANMSVAESLNSVVRFSIYMAVLLTLTSSKPIYLIIIPAVMAVTVSLERTFPKAKKITENFVSAYVGDEVTRPTPDNPFMNASLADINDTPQRPPAADVTAVDVRDEVNSSFAQTSNMYMDTTDVFSMVQSQRNFYTVPEDDHEGLLKFLGKNAQSDKLLNEGYVAAKGTVAELPTAAISVPKGTAATTSFSS
jgi:hypothetical protein